MYLKELHLLQKEVVDTTVCSTLPFSSAPSPNLISLTLIPKKQKHMQPCWTYCVPQRGNLPENENEVSGQEKLQAGKTLQSKTDLPHLAR